MAEPSFSGPEFMDVLFYPSFEFSIPKRFKDVSDVGQVKQVIHDISPSRGMFENTDE